MEALKAWVGVVGVDVEDGGRLWETVALPVTE